MDERSSQRIERDIERTRADMSETIDALERKLSPGELFDEFWGRVKSGDTGANVGETIRDHPVPLALMGLGLGWLAIEKATGSRGDQPRSRHGYDGQGTYARAEGRVGPYRGDEVIDPDLRYDDSGGVLSDMGDKAGALKDRVADAAGDMKDRLGSAAGAARDKASDMGDRMRTHGDGSTEEGGPGLSDRAHHLRDSADDQMRQARDAMGRRGSQLESGFRSLLRDYPLALGAISFGIGLAAGASAPTTEMEDELMGDAADTLKDEVRNAARETGQSVREVATETVRAARSEVEDQGMGDDLKSKAERVVHAAKSTAQEEAQSQGLTGDALKDRARDAGQKTAETARQSSSREAGTDDGPRNATGGMPPPPGSGSTGLSGGTRPGGLFDERGGDRPDSR